MNGSHAAGARNDGQRRRSRRRGFGSAIRRHKEILLSTFMFQLDRQNFLFLLLLLLLFVFIGARTESRSRTPIAEFSINTRSTWGGSGSLGFDGFCLIFVVGLFVFLIFPSILILVLLSFCLFLLSLFILLFLYVARFSSALLLVF